MTNKPLIKSYVDEKLAYKIRVLAKLQGLSVSAYIAFVLRDDIEAFEEVYGEISPENEAYLEKAIDGLFSWKKD